MIVLDHEQRSDEWYEARLGIPTASNFDKIVTTSGELSKQSQKYLYKLAGEKVSGQCEESYQNGAMIRGIELEDEARNLYSIVKGVDVDQVGFCLHDSKMFGASPDGLVGDDGLIEIKCPTMSVAVEYLVKKKLPTTYIQQIQGQLLVTGRKWVDFFSFYPGLSPLIVRVEADEAFHRKLENALTVFIDDLQKVIAKITQ